MNIVIVTNYCQTPAEKGNNRFNYIAEMFANAGHQVEFITSTFSHRRKQQRKREEEGLENLPYKFSMVYEPGYKKNVTPVRFYSHWIFARNVKQYLNKLEKKPDIIYCAVPSLDAAKVVCKYAKKNKIPFIIDIQDLWPESFQMVFRVPVLSDILFFPLLQKVNEIYKGADSIIAVSKTYVDRAGSLNTNAKHKLSVYLGIDLEYFDSCKNNYPMVFKDNYIRIVYTGTLGHSYDIKTVIDAFKLLKDKGIDSIKLLIIGDGPLKQEFEEYAKNKKVDCEFTGRMEYAKMVGTLCGCDIAVNPINKYSVSSIINKVGDYAAAGLPVINTQESAEYRKLVEEYNIGLNCENGIAESIAEGLEKLVKDETLRKQMGANNRRLAEEKFDRRTTYPQILKVIEDYHLQK